MGSKSWLVGSLALLGCEPASVVPSSVEANPDADNSAFEFPSQAPVPFLAVGDVYVAEFVSTAATGSALNDAEDVVGTSYPDPGCGPFCLPTQETVVWQSDGTRIVLPELAGFDGIYVRGIDPTGAVVGLAGLPGTTTTAVIWKPDGLGGYTVTDLGALSGHTSSEAIGIDDQGRVVGWSTTTNFPPDSAPFLWTETDGMTDLSAAGFPDEVPLSISPGGMIATVNNWYDLDDPLSVTAVTAPPVGYLLSAYPAAINDDGEQVRWLVSTGAQNLLYLFRYHTDGTWEQQTFLGQGFLTSFGLGSIDADGTYTATTLSTGYVAWGPDGFPELLTDYLSVAYPLPSVSVAGPQRNGEILAQMMVGASSRLVRFVPETPCTSSCLKVNKLTLNAKFIEDPANPGQCFSGGSMHNVARAKVTITDETGKKLKNVEVSGRFLDNYWANEQLVATTNSKGIATFDHDGPCGVGTLTFWVDDAVFAGSTFDRTTGTLYAAKIPQ